MGRVWDMEILRWFVEHFRTEGRVIRQAPAAFIAGLIILGAFVFVGVDWHYSGTETAQRATIATQQATIDQLRDQLRGTSPQLAAIQAGRDRIRKQLQEFYVEAMRLDSTKVTNETEAD